MQALDLVPSPPDLPPACSMVRQSTARMPYFGLIPGYASAVISYAYRQVLVDPNEFDQKPAKASSILLSTISIPMMQTANAVLPIYMPGRFRTASRPSEPVYLFVNCCFFYQVGPFFPPCY